MQTKKRALMLAGSGAMLARNSLAQSSRWPEHPIRIVVPFTPGSGSDTSSRFFGEQIALRLNQPVVVENKPGANGLIALQYVKSQPANGYTVLLASNSPMAVNPWVIKNLGYDPALDFTPVYGLTRGMNVLITAPSARFVTVQTLLAEARTTPVTMGTYSAGYWLALAWLASLSASQFTNVPYKGQAPIVTDVIGQHLDAALVDLGGAMALIKDGKLKALAVTGETRHPELPDVPNVRELGYPDYVQYSWTSFYVRTGTTDDVIETLAAAVAHAHSTDGARALVAKSGGELMPWAPAQMRRFHLSEIARFRRIAQDAHIQPV